MSAASREIHVDVTEVEFQTVARIVHRGNERLLTISTMLADLTTDLLIATDVSVLVVQPPKTCAAV
ncbi:MAG: hypothetical protein AABZ47_01315 [Planctomycetota bacterium]